MKECLCKTKLKIGFNDYQEKAGKTAIAPPCYVKNSDGEYIESLYLYPALGLSDEAGEVLGKVKKLIRDKHGVVDDEDVKAIQGEIGDVLWYIQQLCTSFNLKLADVAQSNLDKLYDRKARGVIGGSGDTR